MPAYSRSAAFRREHSTVSHKHERSQSFAFLWILLLLTL